MSEPIASQQRYMELERAFRPMPLPVWVYSVSANAFRWANPAGLALWDAASLQDLRGRDLSDIRAVTRHRLKRTLARLEHERQITEVWTVYPGGVPRTETCTIWRVDWAGDPCLGIMALPAGASQRNGTQHRRQHILEAVAHSAERLLGGGRWRDERNALVAAIGRAAKVDRSYFFRFEPVDPANTDAPRWIASQECEWCAGASEPQIDNPLLQNIDLVAAGLGRWPERFARGLPVVAAGPEQLTESERAILDPQDIVAICVQPVRVDEEVVGFIGFDICAGGGGSSFEGWTSDLVDALSTAAHMASAAFKMERGQDRLQAALDEARRASQAKSLFMANMSHELRTPLNAIIGFSEVMETETLGPLPPRYRGYAQDIRSSGQHLLSLVNDVLDLEKALSGRMALEETPLRLLDDVLQASLRLAAETAERNGVRIDLDVHDPDCRLYADARKLTQVVTNLLTNAAKYSEPGGTVDLRTDETDAGAVTISVRDQGIGMTAAEIARAREPFTQVGDHGERHQTGTGLGLPLVLELTRRHGGRVDIDSTPGHGTTVTVTLPPDRRLTP